MEEDEEVDIVGGLVDNFMSKNEREISNISSGQILSCEYTVHPRWLSDNNDGTELWPENLPKQSSQDEMELVQDEVVIEEPAPIDFDWCEEQETEEISNCGDIIFEQDIPASLEEEVVTNSGTEAEYDDTSDYCNRSSSQQSAPDDNQDNKCHIPDTYVPVSTNPNSLLRKSFVNAERTQEKPQIKFKQTLMVNKSLLKLNQRTFKVSPNAGTSLLKPQIRDKILEAKKMATIRKLPSKPAPKFKQSVFVKWNLPHPKCQKRSKNSVKKHKEHSNDRISGKPKTGGKIVALESTSGKGSKKFVDLHGENITISHEADNSANIDETASPVENVDTVKQQPNTVKVDYNSDSDVEIDIESEAPNDLIEIKPTAVDCNIKLEPEVKPSITIEKPKIKKIKSEIKKENEPSFSAMNANCSPDLVEALNTLEKPGEELKLPPETASEIERYLHSEFFENRPTKTPERYMKIRDFILNVWNESKPSYVSKTTVRNGLKHCGDVNCISRIHCMLEQIGAINFGYDGIHFDYIRPLSKLKEHFIQSTRNKSNSTSNYESNIGASLVIGRRQRNKSFTTVYQSAGERDRDIDANYTVSHVNGVPSLVYASMPKERESLRREASKPVKMEFELIECLRFTKDKIPPFKISITLSTLICLHLHALSSKFEVMGFLGGFCTKSVGRNKLSLTRYKPCKTAHQTGTTCEMCPVSQVEQAANLTSEGYELLGWFHSHPAFEPNPSRTDVATQADMQHQFSMESDRPFIGFILGCIDMRYNCMYILPKDIHKDTIDVIPYGFEVDIIKDCSSLRNDIADVFNVIDRNSHTYAQTIERFKRTATDLLRCHGYEWNITDYLNDYL